MQHANAPLAAIGGLRMVLLVEEEGFTLHAAADACNVAKSTCWEWVRRWRAACEADRVTLACLEDRSSRPHRSPNQVPVGEATRICERRARTGWSPRRLAEEADIARSHSTIHQVLRRGGCSHQPRPQAPAVVRYEWPYPGNRCTWTSRSSAASTHPDTL
jgi:transposase